MNQKLQNIISIFVPIFLIVGTISVYFFAKGYRIDLVSREIEQTGVISVATSPRRAALLLDGKTIGQTPKTIGSLRPETHTISIEKPGYHSWETVINVHPEHLIPLTVQLFLLKPTTEPIFSHMSIETCPDITEENETSDTISEVTMESTIEGFYSDTDGNVALYTHIYASQSCEDNTVSPRTLQIWAYPVKRQFWERNTNTRLIAEFTSTLLGPAFEHETPQISLTFSPDGRHALIHTIFQDYSRYFSINTAEQNSQIHQLDSLEESGIIKPQWSMDSLHLIYSKNSELRTINSQTYSVSVITELPDENVPPLFWTTNLSGEIYFSSQHPEYMSITRSNPDGSNQTNIFTVIRTADSTATSTIPEDIPPEEIIEIPLMEIGTVHALFFDPTEELLFLFSQNAITSYSLINTAIRSYPARNPELISISPLKQSFIYLDDDGQTLREFWFNPVSTDILHPIGPKTLLSFDPQYTYSSFRWHPKGTNVLYAKYYTPDTGHLENITADNDTHNSGTSIGNSAGNSATGMTIETVDTESLQVLDLVTLEAIAPFSVDTSGTSVVTLCNPTEICLIRIK